MIQICERGLRCTFPISGMYYAGIGRAIAKSLLSAGAAVYALDKSQQNLDSLVTEVLIDGLID